MQTRRWTNPSQPQTLQIAVFLLYADAVLAFVFGAGSLPGLLITVFGGAAAGLMIANEKKNGWYLGIAVAALPLLLRIGIAVSDSPSDLLAAPLALMFEIALFALLVHDQTRNYVRIWFK